MSVMNETQSIDKPWGASVFGAASVEAAPDVARLRVAIKQTRSKPGEAFEVTRGAVNQVRDVLRGHSIPDAAVSTSRLSLRSMWNFTNNERNFLGYECTASFVIELRELDILEAVLIDVVEAGANQVDAVEFDVRGKMQLRAQAREAAIAAAQEKAELYARASGVRLGPVIHIKDVDSEPMQNNYRSHGQSGGASGEGDLAPGKVSVSAGVVIGFSLISDRHQPEHVGPGRPPSHPLVRWRVGRPVLVQSLIRGLSVGSWGDLGTGAHRSLRGSRSVAFDRAHSLDERPRFVRTVASRAWA
jgi:uncharacterized protein YggE